jgi:lysylphosphatidylglycerol synthetase-like protein (DUF2156 family)
MSAHISPGPAPVSGDTRGNRLRPWIWGTAAALLLLPAVAMQFTPEVDWTAGDFVAMGVWLAIACALYELGAWLSGSATYRAGFGLAVLTGFLTVWVNLAVGMLGDEGDRTNLMFIGVLAIAGVGALLARFRARGMAVAMALAGAAQLAAVGIAMATGGFDARELVFTALFALPWLAAALLFRMATAD